MDYYGFRRLSCAMCIVMLVSLLPCLCVYSAENLLTIMYTGSDNGIIRSCQCPSNPWGGYPKKTWLMDELSSAAGVDSVLKFHTGDIFTADFPKDKTQLLSKFVSHSNFDLVAVGDMEVDCLNAPGISLSVLDHIKWICSENLSDLVKEFDESKLPSYCTFERSGYKIGVVACYNKASISADGPPVSFDNVARFIDKYRSNLDLLIVLSHQGVEKDKLLAETLSGIDLIIGGHCQTLINPPLVVNNTAIVQAGKNGENLGLLVLSKKDSKLHYHNYLSNKSANVDENALEKDGMSFKAALVALPHWKIAHQIIPLNCLVNEDLKTSDDLLNYENKKDLEYYNMLQERVNDTRGGPRISFRNPFTFVEIERGKTRSVKIAVANRGRDLLTIKKVRSKNKSLTVLKWPHEIKPGKEEFINFELSTDYIDTNFRCEFSVLSTDKLSPVTKGIIKGVATGGIVEGLVPSMLWSELVSSLNSVSYELAPLSPLLIEEKIADEKSSIKSDDRILLEFFYAPNCSECEVVKEDILPECLSYFGDAIHLEQKNVLELANFDRYCVLQERFNIKAESTLSVFVNDKIPVVGLENISSNLINVIRNEIKSQR